MAFEFLFLNFNFELSIHFLVKKIFILSMEKKMIFRENLTKMLAKMLLYCGKLGTGDCPELESETCVVCLQSRRSLSLQ